MSPPRSSGRPGWRGPLRGGLGRWWRRRSLRGRVTLAATAALAVALAAAALLLANALRLSLIRGLDNSARQGAREVAALANKNVLPDPVPVGPGTVTIQVLDRQGRIAHVSPDADRLVPLLPPAVAAANARDGRAVFLDGRPFGLPGEVRVATVALRGGGTVIAAVAYNPVAESLTTLGHALIIGTPVLLVLLAGASWLIVGSTLRPIAELRRGAQDVTRTGQPRALPVPAAHDEVHSLAVTLNDMLSRLGMAQQRQRGLISDTAHELRSPIASIRAQLEVALDHPDSQDWRQTAGDVLADTLRLAALAEDLLVLARLDEADRPPGGPGCRAEHAGRGRGQPVPGRAGAGAAGAGRAVPGDRGPGRAGPDARQPDRQRGPLRADPGGGVGIAGRGGRAAVCGRRRPGHPGGGPGAGLRPVHPAGGGAQPGR